MKQSQNKKNKYRQMIAGAIAIVLVIAMVVPMVLSALM